MKKLIAILGLLLALAAPAAAQNIKSYTANPSVANANTLLYCPQLSSTTAGTDYSCTPAALAAYNYSLMSGDCTVTGGGAVTCTKTNGVAFSALATTAPGSGVVTAVTATVNAAGGIISPTPAAVGDIIYWSGTAWVKFAGNASGVGFLTENSSGAPSWSAGSSSITFTTSCPATTTAGSTIPLTNGIVYTHETASYPFVTSTDCGGWFKSTLSAAATDTLPSAATAGANWYLSNVQNDKASTANLTVAVASGGGTIDGATTLILPPGSSIGLVSDGSNWQVTNGVGPDVLLFSTPGAITYTPNPSIQYAKFACIGSGGGGGSGGVNASGIATGGGAGGGGSYAYAELSAAQIPASGWTGNIQTTPNGGAAASSGAGANGSGAAGTTNLGTTPTGLIIKCISGGFGAGGSASGILAGGGFGAGPYGGGVNASAGANGTSSGGGSGGSTTFPSAVGGGGGGAASLASGLTPSNTGPGFGWNSWGGAAGGGVTASVAANGEASNSSGINNIVTNGGAAGTANSGATAGAGTSTFVSGLPVLNGYGPIGGGSGGGGGGSVTASVAGGAGGAGSYGAGGGGGGACGVACSGTATSGAGGNGGPSLLVVWEFNK